MFRKKVWRQRLAAQMGLARSLLIYYGVPGRQRQLRRFYGQFIRPGDLCFDIGAHVGNRILAWRGLGGRCVALEPQPHLMGFLRRVYGRSEGVVLVEEAVGAEAGELTLRISSRHPTVTTLSENWISAVKADDSFAGVDWDAAVTVPVTTLDELIARFGPPAFCKIDVEGFETEVLRGLSRPLPALSFEYIPAAIEVAQECIETLGRLGEYRYNWSPGERHELAAPDWLTPKEMAAFLESLTPGDGSGDIYGRAIS